MGKINYWVIRASDSFWRESTLEKKNRENAFMEGAFFSQRSARKREDQQCSALSSGREGGQESITQERKIHLRGGRKRGGEALFLSREKKKKRSQFQFQRTEVISSSEEKKKKKIAAQREKAGGSTRKALFRPGRGYPGEGV